MNGAAKVLQAPPGQLSITNKRGHPWLGCAWPEQQACPIQAHLRPLGLGCLQLTEQPFLHVLRDVVRDVGYAGEGAHGVALDELPHTPSCCVWSIIHACGQVGGVAGLFRSETASCVLPRSNPHLIYNPDAVQK